MTITRICWPTPPPARRAKRLPLGISCDGCGGPMRSLPGYWLKRNEYFVACKAGCWGCAECFGTHRKGQLGCNNRPQPAGQENALGIGQQATDDGLL